MFSLSCTGENLLECRTHLLQWSVMSSHAAFMASNRDIWSCALWSYTYINKKVFLVNCWSSGKYIHLLIYIYIYIYIYTHIHTQYLVGAPFALITASIRHGMEVIRLWHCRGGMEAQVSLTVAFSFWSLVSHFPLDNRLSTGFRSGEFAGQSSTPTPSNDHHIHLTNFWCFWQCGPAGKWNQHL